jgi:hypothetical protein
VDDWGCPAGRCRPDQLRAIGFADRTEPSTTHGPVAPASASGRIRLGNAPACAAIAITGVTVYSRPQGDSSITAVFPAKLPWGSPMSFLVQEAYRDAAGGTWLKVMLPRRPNETTGWVRRDQVRLRAVTREVEVDLSSRTARLL